MDIVNSSSMDPWMFSGPTSRPRAWKAASRSMRLRAGRAWPSHRTSANVKGGQRPSDDRLRLADHWTRPSGPSSGSASAMQPGRGREPGQRAVKQVDRDKPSGRRSRAFGFSTTVRSSFRGPGGDLLSTVPARPVPQRLRKTSGTSMAFMTGIAAHEPRTEARAQILDLMPSRRPSTTRWMRPPTARMPGLRLHQRADHDAPRPDAADREHPPGAAQRGRVEEPRRRGLARRPGHLLRAAAAPCTCMDVAG